MGHIYLFNRQSPDSEIIEGFYPVILLITPLYFFTVLNNEQLQIEQNTLRVTQLLC